MNHFLCLLIQIFVWTYIQVWLDLSLDDIEDRCYHLLWMLDHRCLNVDIRWLRWVDQGQVRCDYLADSGNVGNGDKSRDCEMSHIVFNRLLISF